MTTKALMHLLYQVAIVGTVASETLRVDHIKHSFSLLLKQLKTVLVIREVRTVKVDSLPLILHHLRQEHAAIEQVLKLLIRIVDEELFKSIVLEILEA